MNDIKNCIIMGSGRSGTSLMAGILKESGYYLGKNLHPPSVSNPKGYFESSEINKTNEAILKLNTRNRPPFLGRYFFKNIPAEGQRWLSVIPHEKPIVSSKHIHNTIKKIVSNSKTPFCFKDPRFSYTLPVWLPYLQNTVFIVVFRHPTSTINSIVKDCSVMPYLQNLKMTEEQAATVWLAMYNKILNKHYKEGKWLFVNYEELIENNGIDEIEYFLGTNLNTKFIDKKLYRSKLNFKFPSNAHQLMYEKLCSLTST